MSGTSASSAGYPTGSSRNGFSLAGRPSTWLRKPMGLGVCVKVASPMLCSAVIRKSHAMPTDSRNSSDSTIEGGSNPRDTQKADGIRSHRSIVDSVIPLSLKGFTIHSQACSLKMGPEKGGVAFEMPAVETLDALFHPSQCGRRYVRLSVRQAYAFLTRQTTTTG
jgi:hypothetical protein